MKMTETHKENISLQAKSVSTAHHLYQQKKLSCIADKGNIS